MLGTILFSSKIRYGKNKRNIPYYLFISDFDNKKYIVASKLGSNTKVDHYAKIDIIDINSNPPKGCIKIMFGPVNVIESCVKMYLEKYKISSKIFLDTNIRSDSEKRLDLTSNISFSIDPEDTKDIDDAFHFIIENDKLELGIHITDLSEIELSDDSLEVFTNKFSTFYLNNLGDLNNINLFNETICNQNNSLIQDNDRKCISLIINFDQGINYEFKKTVIKNSHKINYEKADKLICKNEKFIKLVSILEIYWGKINNSHELIEKMMIFYNNKMAEYLFKMNLDFPIRVHQGINKKLFERYSCCYNKIDENIMKKICYHSAEYVNARTCEKPYHFGLNIKLYTHATSPLRRVTDYLVQQIYTYNTKYDINKLCDILNQRQQEFKNAYRVINEIKLIQEIKDSKDRIYDAIVINYTETKITIYIFELDLIYNVNILNKLNELIDVKLNDTNINISHIESKLNVDIQLLQKVKINIMITPYEFNINKKIRIYLVEPNLINLFNY